MNADEAARALPTASIRSYLDRQLEMFVTEDGYELRCEEQLLASLGDPKFEASVACVTRDGQWQFNRLSGGNTKAVSGSAAGARHKSDVLSGGAVGPPDA